MSKVVINRIHYKHFKGLKDFKLALDGHSAKVSGPNGSGKTTLADGFLWLLFGKDTKGTKLNPKPKDNEMNEILGLEPTVEAELVIDGELVTMKRVQKEKWASKRGELEKTRGNDSTDYFINGVPQKEKEWKAFIEKINLETTLQMMTDASFFMRMNWKDRRDVLIGLTGLTDAEIISMDPELLELESVLEDKSIEDMKKILASRKKELQDNIKSLPGRIQENQDMIDRLNLSELDKGLLEAKLEEAQQKLEQSEMRVVAAENGNATLDYKERVAQLNLKLSEERNRFLATANLASESLRKDSNALQDTGSKIRTEHTDLKMTLRELIQEKEQLERQKDVMLVEYNKIKAQTFDEHKKECAMCGQGLPDEQIESMIARFNKERSQALEGNISSGKTIASKIATCNAAIKETQEAFEAAERKLEDLLQQHKLINEELNKVQAEGGQFEDTDVYLKIKKDIEALQQQILNAKADSTQIVQEAIRERDAAKEEVKMIIESVFKFDQVIPIEARMAELRSEDSALKQQNMEVERQLFLIDEFTRKKVKYLEESINNHFELVKFKLFNIQKNGGLDEVCEATFNGVDYSAGMSTGERGRCDLDIVSGLSKGLNISMPVFLDNAESITLPISFDGQLIQLFAKDEEFRVEVGG